MPLFPRNLYKFRPVPEPDKPDERRKLEALLLDNVLWLADPETFNDPFDGKSAYDLTVRGPELRREIELLLRRQGMTSAEAKRRVRSEVVANPGRLQDMLSNNMEVMRRQLGICSLSAAPRNPLLWAHYAKDHRGICVQLRLAADITALAAHPVEYQDEFPVLRNFDRDDVGMRAATPFLRKSTDWAYEREYRIVGPDQTNQPRRFAPRALSGVIFGMRASDDDKAYIRSLMDERQRRFGFRPKIFQAKAAERAYRLTIYAVAS